MLSQRDVSRSHVVCRTADSGYEMEHFVNKEAEVLVPTPACISFPWEESSNTTNPQSSVRNSGLRIISDSEPTVCTVILANEPHRERRRWARPRILQSLSTSSENTHEEKSHHCETEEKYFTSRECSRDNRNPQRTTTLCNTPESKCHGILNSESNSVIFLDECRALEKHSALFELSGKNRSLDDHTHDNTVESPIAARIPSPSSASSITSGKRLEWDSGADVGYNFIQDSNVNLRANLSTIERLALVRGCSTALFERLDPEGTSGRSEQKPGTVNSALEFDSPIAKSTPILKDENKVNQRIVDECTIVEPAETVLTGGYLYLHSGEEFENEVAPPQNVTAEHSKNNSDDEKILDSDIIHKKHSNSLINLSCSSEEVPASVPRSQSYLNLLTKEDDCLLQMDGTLRPIQPQCPLVTACSVSSSSLATIVQKPVFPQMLDKFIQTLPLKLSIGVQVSENTEISPMSQRNAELQKSVINSAVGGCVVKQSGKETLNCNRSLSHKCNGAHKKGSVVNNSNVTNMLENSSFNPTRIPLEAFKMEEKKISLNRGVKNKTFHTPDKESSTLESVASRAHTAGSSCVAETSCSGAGIQAEGPRGSTGIVGSAHSFEYLPGDVFEDNFKSQNKTSLPHSSETSTNQIHSDQGNSDQNNEACNQEQTSCSTSLTKDIEEGVELLQKLMSDKSFNGKMKKKVIRQIVNKLVNTDYAEDLIDNAASQSVPLSCNVPWTPAPLKSQSLKNVDLHHKFGTGDLNQRNKSVSDSSMPSSNGTLNRRLVCSVSNTHTSSSSCTPSGSLSVPGDNEESHPETSEISLNTTSKNAKRDWKLPTSKSEKKYEEKQIMTEKSTSSTPPLLRLCKTEHEKQLQWIRFEIDHLTHLKQLLEKQEGVTRTLSNLAAHEHKFHKIKQVDRSTSPNSNFSRFKMKNAENWSNSTEYSRVKNNNSMPSNESSISKTSTNAVYREPSSSSLEFSVHSKFREAHIPQVCKRETLIRQISNKHDFCTQTPTLNSYVLCNAHDDSVDTKRSLTPSYSSRNEVGRLNVYMQTSPKTVNKQNLGQQGFPDYGNISEKATESFESAVKCCCDCKQTLKEIINVRAEYSKKKREVTNIYCKCNPVNAKSHPHVIHDRESSSTQVDALSEPCIDKSNNSEAYPRKKNIATETVVNKSIQTSSSLIEVPIIKPMWNVKNAYHKETKKNLPNKAKDKYCPCCGLPEKQSYVGKKQNDSEPEKCIGTRSEHFYERRKEKNKPLCNASVQTSAKEPLAYLLTFEPTCQENTKLQKRDSLPEIKLLVPIIQSKLENEVKQKVPVVDSSKENRCPTEETQCVLDEHDQATQDEEKRKKQKLTLQEYLRANRPDYIQHADKRTQCLADLALLRDLRKQKRLELMAMADKQHIVEIRDDSRDERIICSGGLLSGKSKFTSRMMREQSRRKYHRTREVQNRLAEKKKKEDFRTNRLMAELFTKKLQRKVLQGVVNHSNAASVVSSVP